MTDSKDFEMRPYPQPDGRELLVPVYLNDEELAARLAMAALVIASTFSKEGYLSLEQLADRVQRMLGGEASNGLVIEDEDALTSVTITPTDTIVHKLNTGDGRVNTSLLLDMLNVWLQTAGNSDNRQTDNS